MKPEWFLASGLELLALLKVWVGIVDPEELSTRVPSRSKRLLR